MDYKVALETCKEAAPKIRDILKDEGLLGVPDIERLFEGDIAFNQTSVEVPLSSQLARLFTHVRVSLHWSHQEGTPHLVELFWDYGTFGTASSVRVPIGTVERHTNGYWHSSLEPYDYPSFYVDP